MQAQTHSKLHSDLCVVVRKHDPPQHRPAAHPLVIMWESASAAKTVSILLSFRTRDSPMEMLFLHLGPSIAVGQEPPFCLQVTFHTDRLDVAPQHDNALAICAKLAMEASDWVIHRLELADIEDSPADFQIAAKISYDAAVLREEARQQKEKDLAMRAFRLLERLKSGQKRKRQSKDFHAQKVARQNAPSRVEAGDTSPSRLSQGSSWSDHSDWAGSAGEEDQDPWRPLGFDLKDGTLEFEIADLAADTEQAVISTEEGPSSDPGASGRACPAGKPKRQLQKRGIPWGPFLLSPIVPKGGQTGWGAICGLHRNRGDPSGARCKKAMNLSGLDHSTCLLRLKRWLLAGLDEEFSAQNARSDHVAMGGAGLKDFAEGKTEEEMDEAILRYVHGIA